MTARNLFVVKACCVLVAAWWGVSALVVAASMGR